MEKKWNAQRVYTTDSVSGACLHHKSAMQITRKTASITFFIMKFQLTTKLGQAQWPWSWTCVECLLHYLSLLLLLTLKFKFLPLFCFTYYCGMAVYFRDKRFKSGAKHFIVAFHSSVSLKRSIETFRSSVSFNSVEGTWIHTLSTQCIQSCGVETQWLCL